MFYLNKIMKNLSSFSQLAIIWVLFVAFGNCTAAVAGTIFDAPGAKTAVDAFENKFTALQVNISNANTSLQALKSKIDAAKSGQYSANASVVAALATAQTTYDTLNNQLGSAPKQADLESLKTALAKYTEAAGAAPIIKGLEDQIAATQQAFAPLATSFESANKLLITAQNSIPAEFKAN